VDEPVLSKSVVTLIPERIVRDLTVVLTTNIAEDDPTRVDAVKLGRFQATPNTEPRRVYVMNGDIEDPKWADEIADPERNDNELAFRVWPREIGGGEMWWRKGIVQFELFFLMTTDRPEEDLSRAYAHIIVSRAEQTMREVEISDLEDIYGESAIKLFCPRTSTLQAGGPSNQYVWRGKLYWAALTERFA
jgi:hypothetical protein